ncbi:MAG TPA: hydrogenase maturation protease [Spirochaetia bacterium]|nr:hydrogenase maturation protease [Spirochaetia bacterium]
MFFLGNPILRNDRIGLLIGARLKEQIGSREGFEVREFVGSPLSLLTEIQGRRQLIIIDSIVSGSLEKGSIAVFGKEEIRSFSKTLYPHGMNLPEVVALSEKLGIELPGKMILIGIEVGRIERFGESLDPDLEERLEDIYQGVCRCIEDFLGD